MLLERAKSAIFERQTLFWLFALGLFGVYIIVSPDISLPFDRRIQVKTQTLPGLVLAFALLVTFLWSYIFLLIPVYRMKRLFQGRRTCAIVFHSLFWASFALSGYFVFVYVVALSDPSPISGSDSLAKAFQKLSREPWVGQALYAHHLFLFVLLYTLMDFLIAVAGNYDSVRKRFANVVVFIDVPILLTMLFIESLFQPVIGTLFYYFEAGVVSFQLIVGSFSIIALELVAGKFSMLHNE